MYKYLISFAIAAFLLTPVFAFQASAQNIDFGMDEVDNEIELANRDPRAIVGDIINVALGFLGVIALVIILMGGFKWMTAAGNEDKTSEAKKLLGAGVIGLIIVLAAWAISSFVINAIYNATTGV